MSGKTILKSLGIQSEEEPISIYPFSPVYHVNNYIAKRTQRPLLQAQRLMEYTNMLAANGVSVVTPVKEMESNPKQINNDVYVVYPFIDGDVYKGEPEQIQAAGALLGQIHAMSPAENTYQLKTYDVYDFYDYEVEESIENISDFTNQYDVHIDSSRLNEKLIQVVNQQKVLKNRGLPHVATPHDYKANNLIFTPEPYLIDPDNAAWIPRTFDLALCLLLFHNEMPSAPNRVFTTKEWALFLKGYSSHVTLSKKECLHWQQTIEHVFLDEVMWLMADVPEDWEKPAQRALFESLVNTLFCLNDYPL
ncbi:phosphotransferase [Bacillus sp. JCM 19041]|uniref:phosphotransferase n=1 Tax=Bacillus sp. JCM 19041 TaxID=1460637 RepID=UPI0006D01852